MTVSRPKAQIKSLASFATAEAFLRAAQEEKLDPKTTALVFPSDVLVYTFKNNLYGRYTPKKDTQTGLANVANLLSDLGTPTLDLPFVNHHPIANKKFLPAEVINAVAELWKAFGYGIHLLIPDYWKTDETNTALRDYYLEQFDLLKQFSQSNDADPSTVAGLSPDCVNAYHRGAELREQGNGKGIDWFQPNPVAPRVNTHFEKMAETQDQARFWKTAAAWTFGILLGVPTLGLLAIPIYYLWRNDKDKEDIQAVAIKPTEYAALDQFRKMLMESTEDAKKSRPIQDRDQKPKKLKPEADAAPDQEQVYLMDKFAKARHDLVMGMFQAKRTDIKKEELDQLEALTQASIKLGPSLKPAGIP